MKEVPLSTLHAQALALGEGTELCQEITILPHVPKVCEMLTLGIWLAGNKNAVIEALEICSGYNPALSQTALTSLREVLR